MPTSTPIFGAGRDLADFEVPIARFDHPQPNRTGPDLGVAAQAPAALGPALMSSSWSASPCTSAYARRDEGRPSGLIEHTAAQNETIENLENRAGLRHRRVLACTVRRRARRE
jgi:hypothetical protein